MTNKQAKEIMLKLKEEITNDFDVLEDEEKEAFNKAIEALEQEPSEDMTTLEKMRAEIANLTCDCISGMINQYAVLQIIDKYAEQEPKTGYWTYICNSEVNGLKIVECSRCGKRTYGSGKYCPNCGTKMVEPQESEVRNE